MYKINKNSNNIEEIKQLTFKELGFRERDHLQEWIRKNPGCLKEEFLIIQKEFSGFNDTNERLDLLALDRSGNLVVIENKLDDSGKDVTWQVLKYASYCSSLNSSDIINIYNQYLQIENSKESAEEMLQDFFESEDYEEILSSSTHQRIMLVAGEYRKEVTSTVLWLINNYGLRIQCFKASPFKMSDSVFVNFEQIIPMPDAEDFIIGMAHKNRSTIQKKEELKNRHHLRLEFWKEMLSEINLVTDLYQNVNPTKDSWISAGSGMSGVTITLVFTQKYIRIELAIWGKSQEGNKMIFDYLESRKNEIESLFGESLVWERMLNKRMSRIKFEKTGLNAFDKEDWPLMIDFVKNNIVKFEKSFNKSIKEVNTKFKKEGVV
tara:strand:+ start:1620 stop:2753 length:1134 start_codon:yes stop_codon:yes gene_type:complete